MIDAGSECFLRYELQARILPFCFSLIDDTTMKPILRILKAAAEGL